MKVLQINTVCGSGSTGRIAVDLYHKLEAQGHECLIAYGRGKAPEGIHAVRIGNDLDNYIHAAMTRITDKTGFYSRRATRKLIEKIKEYQPDLIHLHNLHGYYLDIRQLFYYIRKEQIPVVWTLHDCWPFTGHCSYFDSAGCNRWQEGCHNCPQKKEYPASIVFDNSQWNYNQKKQLFTSLLDMQIITPSKWLQTVVKQSFLNKYPVNYIYNGIDPSVFKPRKSNILQKYNINNKFVILGVSNVWATRKGLQDFCSLSSQLGNKYQIILVGVNENQLKELPKSIIGIKRTENLTELTELYTAADVYMNLSCEETFGMTTIEALACGTPVIVYDKTAIAEPIKGSYGKALPYGNLSAVITAVKQLQSLPVTAAECINAASQYKLEYMLNHYYEIYRLLEKSAGNGS